MSYSCKLCVLFILNSERGMNILIFKQSDFFFICHQSTFYGTIKLLQILIEKLIEVKITNIYNKISIKIQGSRKTYIRKKYS